jgi:hypothetical protein
MTNSRSVVLIFGVALLSAPLICAQGLRPSGSATIQQLTLQPQAVLAGLSFQVDSIPPSAQLPDLSRYREFRLGMTLPEVTKQTDTDPSEVTVVHQRPVLIQEVDWRPPPPSSPLQRRIRLRASTSVFAAASSFEWWSITLRTEPRV